MNTIVIGFLNTDIVATGIRQFPGPGEHVFGRRLHIGPGGKPRNIADMIARLSPKASVAMVGRTVRDSYGLWRVPVDALIEAGVNTDYITIADYSEEQQFPGVGLIPVDVKGNNQIMVVPGANDDFSPLDIDNASPLFGAAGKNNGSLVLTLECPLGTAIHAVELANKHDLKVMFDPGGAQSDTDASSILKAGVYLIKPNEHEAKMLTGIDVIDLASAKQAAEKLRQQGAENVLISAGASGAYLFAGDIQKHIPAPDIEAGTEKDETGCGDQAMAALCAAIQDRKTIEEAAELAVLAGTMQFYRRGVKPVAQEELNMWFKSFG